MNLFRKKKDSTTFLSEQGPMIDSISKANEIQQAEAIVLPDKIRNHAYVIHCVKNNVCPICGEVDVLKSRSSSASLDSTRYLSCNYCGVRFVVYDHWYDDYRKVFSGEVDGTIIHEKQQANQPVRKFYKPLVGA